MKGISVFKMGRFRIHVSRRQYWVYKSGKEIAGPFNSEWAALAYLQNNHRDDE